MFALLNKACPLILHHIYLKQLVRWLDNLCLIWQNWNCIQHLGNIMNLLWSEFVWHIINGEFLEATGNGCIWLSCVHWTAVGMNGSQGGSKRLVSWACRWNPVKCPWWPCKCVLKSTLWVWYTLDLFVINVRFQNKWKTLLLVEKL